MVSSLNSEEIQDAEDLISIFCAFVLLCILSPHVGSWCLPSTLPLVHPVLDPLLVSQQYQVLFQVGFMCTWMSQHRDILSIPLPVF